MSRLIAVLVLLASTATVAESQTYFMRQAVPQSKKAAAPVQSGTTCGVPQANMWTVGQGGAVIASTSGVASADAAAAWCNGAKAQDMVGMCLWGGQQNGSAYLVTGNKLGPYQNSGTFAAACG